MSDSIPPSKANPLFDFQIVEMQGHSVLVLTGEVDTSTAPQFKHAIMSVLDGGEQHLIIDAQNIAYMDSIGISILLSVVKRLSDTGGTVNLVGCRPHIERLFLITRTAAYIALHKNIEDAVRAISAQAN